MRQQLARLERELAEREASEQRLAGLLERLHHAVYRMSLPDGRYEYFSPHASAVFGYRAADFLATPLLIREVIHPDFRDYFHQQWEKLLQGEVDPTYEYRIVDPAGNERWISQTNTGVRDRQGRLIALEGCCSDITERKRVEQALRESEERANSFVRSSPMGIFTYCVDEHDRLVFVDANPAADLILGVDCRQFIGSTLEEAFPPLAGTEVPAAYRRAALEGVTWRTSQVDYQDERIRGAYEVHAFPTGPRRMAALFLDITEQLEQEAQRRRLEAQVLHAQKLESLGILAGGIAHDFNNLLCGILGGADLALCELEVGHPARRDLDMVRQTAHTATELCRQLLAYSGKGRFVVEPLDLSREIQEMSHLLRVSVSRTVTVRYDLARELPAAEVDGSQLRQIVLNLAVNASEAIGSSSGVLSIVTGSRECEAEDLQSSFTDDSLPAGRYVFVEVADTGCGMDEKTRQRLFDPFFTTKFTGRGLGLAATLGIVRGHGGAIQVHSEPGRGTTFKVFFPASTRPVTAVEKPPAEREWRAAGTVLLVDDDDTVREVTRRMLERGGFSVVPAEDGVAAVEAFELHREGLVLVLLDMTMPRMSGEETFRRLRELDSTIPVLLMSGYNEQEATSRFIGQGLAGFLQKPFRAEALLEKARQAMGEAGPRSGPGGA